MNSSVKTTAASFLAAAALGAVIFMGCTLNSDTDNDTDAGTSRNDASTSTGDSSTATDAGEVCPSKHDQTKGTFGSAACQACAQSKCCSTFQACFALPAAVSDAGEEVGFECNGYLECSDSCITRNPTDETARNQCFVDECNAAAAPGVPEAWDALVSCAETQCATECQ